MTAAVATRERPVMFSAESVRAILDGTKTQTRRVISMPKVGGAEWSATLDESPDYLGCLGVTWQGYGLITWDSCLYGQPGDHLRVREAWATAREYDTLSPAQLSTDAPIWYLADGDKPQWAGKTRSPLFMPRWASRITLEVVNIRVERLQHISNDDARAEGVEPESVEVYEDAYGDAHYVDDYQTPFEAHWESINRKRKGCAWADNPYVWVVDFKRV